MELPADNVVVFDGLCRLCSGLVSFIIRRDRAGVFQFASLQSETGKRLVEDRAAGPLAAQTILLLTRERTYMLSDAVLEIARHLDGAWKAAVLFKILPRPARDWAYRLVARNRYRWFGRRESCLIPTPDLRARFLE